MTLPRPLCAWCGKPLSKSGATVELKYDVPGRPVIGWHCELCHSDDPLAKECTHGPDEPGPTLHQRLREIRKRGRQRVSAGKLFDGWIRKKDPQK